VDVVTGRDFANVWLAMILGIGTALLVLGLVRVAL
jgi:hypothetical protein